MKSNKMIGISFFIIATILYCTKYISAAIYMASSPIKNEIQFDLALKFIGNQIDMLSIIAVIIGCLIIFVQIGMEMRKNKI